MINIAAPSASIPKVYDAIVDSTFSGSNPSLPTYATLAAAIAAQHISILVKHPGDTAAITVASGDAVSQISGDVPVSTAASLTVNLTVSKAYVIVNNLRFQSARLVIDAQFGLVSSCLFQTTSAGITCNSGYCTISQCTFNSLTGTTACISNVGGFILITGCLFNGIANRNAISLSSGGNRIFSCYFTGMSGDSEILKLAGSDNFVVGSRFDIPVTGTTSSISCISGGADILTANYFNVNGNFNGDMIRLSARGFIANNFFNCGTTTGGNTYNMISFTGNEGNLIGNFFYSNPPTASSTLRFVQVAGESIITGNNFYCSPGTLSSSVIGVNLTNAAARRSLISNCIFKHDPDMPGSIIPVQGYDGITSIANFNGQTEELYQKKSVDDFGYLGAGLSGIYTTTLAGGSTVIMAQSQNGNVRLATAATSDNAVAFENVNDKVSIGSGVFAEFYASTSGVTNQIVRMGFGNTWVNADPTDGVYFKRHDWSTPGSWSGIVRVAGTETVTDLQVSGVGHVPVQFGIKSQQDSVQFYVSGIKKGSTITAYPYLLVNPGFRLQTTDANIKMVDVDYLHIRSKRS